MTKRLKNLFIIVLVTAAVSFSPDLLAQEAGSTPIPSQESEEETRRLLSQSQPQFDFLNSLLEEALGVNPSIQVARQSWQASTKRPSQVSSLPNPELSFGSMSTTNPLPYSTIGNGPLSWASFMFMQKIPWPGKLGLRGDIAETEAEQSARHYKAMALQVARQVKENYFGLYHIDRATDTLNRYRDLLDKFSRIAEAQYTVGEGIQADVLRAQVEISIIVERLEILEGKREVAQARINSLLNRSPDILLPEIKPIDIQDLVEIPFSLERMYLMAREANPGIQVEELEIQKASLQLDLANKELFPNFSVSTMYLLRGGPFDNMYEYRLGLEVPLYFWRKERLGVEEKVEDLERARHGYRRRLQDITFRIKDSYVGARTSRRLIELYRQGIIPQATAALDSALSAYEVGTVDFLTLVESALTILNYELRYHEEIRDYYQNLASLEEVLGLVLVR